MKNPITPSWWELNNRSLPVHDPYELARAVAERFMGQPPHIWDTIKQMEDKTAGSNQPTQQDAGEDRLAELQDHMDAIMALADARLAHKTEVASLRAALASQQADAGRLREVLRDHVFYAAPGGYTRTGYTLDTSHETAHRDIGYRKCPLYATPDEAIDAAMQDAALPAPPAAVEPVSVWAECCGSDPEHCDCSEPNHVKVRFTPAAASEPSPDANAVDPGEGWRIVTQGETLQEGDEYQSEAGTWWPTDGAGHTTSIHTLLTYRRRITAHAEQGGAV